MHEPTDPHKKVEAPAEGPDRRDWWVVEPGSLGLEGVDADELEAVEMAILRAMAAMKIRSLVRGQTREPMRRLNHSLHRALARFIKAKPDVIRRDPGTRGVGSAEADRIGAFARSSSSEE